MTDDQEYTPVRGRLQDVLDRLRNEILNGTLRPSARLRLDSLRERYGVSAGTVREALSRLVAEGLVAIDGQRGFRVMPVRAEEVMDIMDTRILLETHALRRAIERADVEWEGRVVGIHHRLSRIEEAAEKSGWKDASLAAAWHSTNREFHLALCEGAESEWVTRFLATLADQTRRYGRRVLHNPETSHALADEHGRLLKAVLARDADEACRVLVEHLGTVRQALVAELSDAAREEAKGRKAGRHPT